MLYRDKTLKTLNIKQGEEHIVFLLIGYSFFMGGAMAVFYTVVVSSFLVNFSGAALPQVYIVGGVLVYGTGILITRLQKILSSEKLGERMLFSLMLSIAVLIAVYYFTGNKWVFFALFIWNRFFVLVNGVTFWAIVAKLFNLQQAKRLSGLINSGEVVSSVIAYLSIPLFIKWVHPDSLLILVVVCLMVCYALIRRIHQRYLKGGIPGLSREAAQKKKELPNEKINRSYYWIIFALALLPVFGLFYVEYIFFTESRIIFPDKQALASFLGIFFGICAIFEFFIKTFFYNKLIAKYGMRMGIIILPVSLAFSFVLAVTYGLTSGLTSIFFACIVLARFFLSAIRKAISDPVYQVLYQPISAVFRLEIQGRIEGRAKSIGGLLAGIFLLVLHSLSITDNLVLSVIFLITLFYWIFMTVKGQGAYKQIFREKIFVIPQKESYKAMELGEEVEPLDFETIPRLAVSPDSSDRYQAAIHLGHSKRFMSFKYLIPLIQDEDLRVRQAAIVAAGELRREELWPYLFEQVSQDRYCALASQALMKSGNPLLKQIDKSFESRATSTQYRIKLIDIVKGIGGAESIKFLRRNLFNTNRLIREKVMLTLRDLDYTASVIEQSHFLQEFDDYIQLYVWLLATQEDLRESYGEESRLMLLIETDKEQMMQKAFIVLELLYGSKFNAIQIFNSDQKEDVRDYLTEIADLLLPDDVKNKLLPFLESTSSFEMLERYKQIFYQNRHTVEYRLMDIVNKDFTRVSRWTKSVALLELRHYDAARVTSVLVSKAISTSKVMSESAYYILKMVNPFRYASLYKIAAEDKDTFHKTIMDTIEHLSGERDLLVNKLGRLRGIASLRALDHEDLQRILLRSTHFNVKGIMNLESYVKEQEVCLVVTHGHLDFSGTFSLHRGDILETRELRRSGVSMQINAVEDTEFYIVETYILQDLSVKIPALQVSIT